jgi:MFS family permease
MVTVLGTMCNNVVNVPLRAIATDLDASVASSVLCVSAFVLALAVAMPLAGWLGDRFGMKRALLWALILMLVAQVLASIAPSLPILIALRGLQGLACSAIPPMVMGLLAGFYPGQTTRMMGAWAAANGVGQAIGPPTGGVVAELFGWRYIFGILAVVCALVIFSMWRFVPALPARASRLHLPGAVLLTSGVGLILVSLTAAAQGSFPVWATVPMAVGGLLCLLGYGLVSRGRTTAIVPVALMIESRFLRSSLAAFAQMFSLGAVLVALPLFFTGPLDMSPGMAGVVFFTLPVVMAVSAPLVSRLSDRTSPRVVLRSGLVILILGSAAIGLATSLASGAAGTTVIVLLMVVLGGAMAMVQTPAAAGAARSPAGRYGAALGVFSMLRFSGSAAAAAWVALVYPHGAYLLLFLGCSVVACCGLAATFFGPDPSSDSPIAPTALATAS